MVSIRYLAPAAALRPYVSSYYWFCSERPTFTDVMRAELPQIRLVTRGEAATFYAKGCSISGVQALLQGPTFQPCRFATEGPLHVFGIGLLPRGWAALIPQPADTLADLARPLSSVFGPAADALLEEVRTADSDEVCIAALNRFLLERLQPLDPAVEHFITLADDWLTRSASPQIEDLVSACGVSQRSLERLCRRYYGAGPKLFARKYRALAAAVRIGTGEAGDWTEVSEGFYDQAHFIREFKYFVGKTPSRFMDESAPITRLTIARKMQMPDLPRLALYS